MSDIYAALGAEQIDAALGFVDERQTLAGTHPELAFIMEPFAIVDFGFGTQKSDAGRALCAELNAYLADLKQSGEYDRLREKWEDPDRDGDVMGSYRYTGEKGTLRIATSGLWTPMSFYCGETLTGEFIEILNGFCASAGYAPQYFAVNLSAELTGLAAGSYDIVADSITPSEERLENMCITDALMADEYYLLVKREPAMVEVPKAPLFMKNLAGSIRRTFIVEDRYKILLSGLRVTVALSLEAGILGTLLGALLCFLRMRDNPWCRAFASLYIRLFRSLPVVVLLLVLNYIVFRYSGLDAFRICAITFCAEIFRSGINAVPDGQHRAATALGFGRMQAFQKVILPQAMAHILPVYSGQFISTVKMTSVAGYISVIDLTKASDIIRSRTYEAFFPLFFTSAVYFLICYVLVTLLHILVRKTDPENRRVKGDIVEIVKGFDPDTDGMRDARGAGAAGAGALLIKMEHLRKSFGSVTPIRDLSCEIRAGDVVSIIGPSGTGKSTFLNLINRLEQPDGGTILFEGNDTLANGYDLCRMREQIGMVFQSFDLFSHLTIVENLMLAQTQLLKRSRAEACRRSMALLHMVGMADKALSLPAQLSGGQQQRAAIVRAVAMDPKLILFDEPTSALDPTMVGEVLAVIRKLAREGMTMMIVTHEMRFARDVSNRVFFLDEGTIYEEGAPEAIFDAPKREKARQFINRLKVFEARLQRTGCDPLNLITRIEQFGFGHMIDRKLVNHMLTMAEELCIRTLLPLVKSGGELKLEFEYGDLNGGSVGMEATYPGEETDPLQGADALSVALIRHACPDLRWEYKNGMCSVRGTLGMQNTT